MLTKTKTQKDKIKVCLTSLGAWILAGATLLGAADLSKELVRQPVIANATASLHAAVDQESNLWSRNDSENETVHMPEKFDIGLRTAVVAGKK